jgi:hypothetical protein
MKTRLGVAMLLALLAACGSDEDSPTGSTPVPPVTTLLDGRYVLVVRPAAACQMPDAPYELEVEVDSFRGSDGDELRATLEGGDPTLVMEMLYSPPGVVSGSISTLRDGVPVPDGPSSLVLITTGTGVVTSAGSGRAEIAEGTLTGDITVGLGDGDALRCMSLEHGFSLLAR